MQPAQYRTPDRFSTPIFANRNARRQVVLDALADSCGTGNIPGPLARTLAERGIRPHHLSDLLQDLVDAGQVVVRRVADGVVHVALVWPEPTADAGGGRFPDRGSRMVPCHRPR